MPVPLGRTTSTRTASPLPDPAPGLAKSPYGVRFNRGQLCMFAGAPGAGKTTVALIMAIRMNVPTLYFSADSDEITMAARAASAITQHPYSDVREVQSLGLYEDVYGEAVNRLPIRFIFDSEPSIPDIADGLEAFQDLWGHYPSLVVCDNLMNLAVDDSNEWQGLRAAVKDLHHIGRRSRACVWVLHHTSEQNEAWISTAPPRGAIQGKLSQLPEVILTLANHEGSLMVGVVKNRHGPSDPKAERPVRMYVDFARNLLWDDADKPGFSFK